MQRLVPSANRPLKFGLLYVGTDDGRLHVSRDSGQNWKEILNGLPKHKWVSRVIASKYDEGTVYMTQNGKRDNDFQVYVWKSTDYGEIWTDISSNIPGGPANVIREDPWAANVLYVGTDMGVYVTNDNAETWEVLGSKLPITFVHDIAIQERDQVMVIATHGRGIHTLKIRDLDRNNGEEEAEEKEAEEKEAKEDEGDDDKKRDD